MASQSIVDDSLADKCLPKAVLVIALDKLAPVPSSEAFLHFPLDFRSSKVQFVWRE